MSRRKVKIYNKVCIQCNRDFIAHRKDVKYCSKQCSNDFHNSKNTDSVENTVTGVLFPEIEHTIETDMEWCIEFVRLNVPCSKINADKYIKYLFPDHKNVIPGIMGVMVGQHMKRDGLRAFREEFLQAFEKNFERESSSDFQEIY